MRADTDIVLGLAVALGCGLLIGIERERRKGRGPRRALAGVRTFTLAAVLGAIARVLDEPTLLGVGAILVLTLAAIGYLQDRRAGTRDPGITTELALFVTYLLGVTAIVRPALAAGAAAVVAIVLAARSQLHRFSTVLLTEDELSDALLLAGFTAATSLAATRYGRGAAILTGAFAGLADVHAAAASVLSLAAGGALRTDDVVVPILIAFTTNTVSKLVAAWVAGSRAYGLRVTAGLVVVTAGVWTPWLLARQFPV